MKDKVSIIIPTYNRAKTIKKSIMSCLNQTYKNIEVIVVDDGSIDNTKDIVKAIKDDRLKYYSYKKNKGACYARNYGINKSTGKYITFNDSDDIYYPNKVEEQYKNLLENKSDMDFSRINIVSSNYNVIAPDDERVKKFQKTSYISELCHGNYISTQTILVKKIIILKYMFDESLLRLQDYDIVLRMVPNSKVSFSDEVLAVSYRQKDSISNNKYKLIDTCKKMLVKDYCLTNEDALHLREYLTKTLEEAMTISFNAKFDIINDKYRDALSKIEELKHNNQILSEEAIVYKTAYEGIINSKRFKLMNKLFGYKKNK